ncbi:similar to Saccharomyces cerevisiae YBR122C MRPL36 Mitochondrial ribosomal protein of the large subunit [Maudiozyma barnettii]|uniref:Similar to Saccharomyces cerevisiae YBR122C MRPL36 Mitochondrial ribosomal protein of the large subunit n=1 Tax=Maudiozyma barnettii TaxID=61262 RepID=A0A8H2ZF39_9SACH|nr:mitochondrial 54S ribosomal protein YmL36 [Kazachstania barnettii]CAB4251920.1 similar to Saccharomyces cerevisiae YBR122C MRPL36 Mitochondrial ribosomal protein of the large subunit [Kazachstania barnettii]CAD1778261.1 similar to Saccharomyces cerevisiae YBR122C MRPL36 Mitochondrial ribosomal protein of the large subunit [Kazachstania barnettii]
MNNNNFKILSAFRRLASTGTYPGSQRMTLPRRPMKKIGLGRARPAIYHQFEVAVEMSDGSVVMRKSQFPKAEVRLIQDQRNNPLWNTSRSDLVVVDANAAGSIDKFKQKYSSIFSVEEEAVASTSDANAKLTTEVERTKEETKKNSKVETAEKSEDQAHDNFGMDDYLSLLDDNSKQIKSGKIASKKNSSKKK